KYIEHCLFLGNFKKKLPKKAKKCTSVNTFVELRRFHPPSFLKFVSGEGMAQRVMGNTCRHKTARQLRCSLKKLPLCDVFQGILLERKRGFKTIRTVLALLIGRKEGRKER